MGTNSTRSKIAGRLVGIAFCLMIGVVPAAAAKTENKGVVAVVNDQPITSFDVDQRIKLTSVLGSGRKISRKEALETLINDVLKRNETARVKATLSDEQLNAAIERLAKGSNTTVEGLTAKLKSVGIGIKALQTQLRTNLSFNRVLIAKYKIKPTVTDVEVDKKLAALAGDPRLKPVVVYELREIVLPVENTGDAMESQLIAARAVEAQQILQNYRSCANAQDAVSGVFNVKVSNVVQAPADKLPKQMQAVLEKAGPNKLIGPMRAKEGIQLIAFCGRKAISPPAPTREQVERLLIDQAYDVYEEKYLRDLRRTALIDYKDAALQQDQTQ